MLCRKKAEGLTEKKAIHILLDCSNTLRINKPEELKEEEVLSPWAGRQNPHSLPRRLRFKKNCLPPSTPSRPK
jgi:hypothetical protein